MSLNQGFLKTQNNNFCWQDKNLNYWQSGLFTCLPKDTYLTGIKRVQKLFYILVHLKRHLTQQGYNEHCCPQVKVLFRSLWLHGNVSQGFPFSFHELKSLTKFFLMTYALHYFIISCSVKDSIYNKWKTDTITLGFHSFRILWIYVHKISFCLSNRPVRSCTRFNLVYLTHI